MSKEAMKLALEALVKALPDMPVHTDWHLEAITALREALAEQPAQQQPAPANLWLYWKVDDKCVVTGPFKTHSKDEAYGLDCIDQTPLTVAAPQPAQQQEPEYIQLRHKEEDGFSPWGQPLDPKYRHNKWAADVEMRLLYTTPQAQPAQQLPFGVGGGLVAIKTLLSRDPCAHAKVAIEMIDAMLSEQPAQQEPVACAQIVSLNDMQGVVEWLPHNGATLKAGDYLYTPTPAQRKPWVGLTPEDKVEILRANGEAAVLILAEAKLREKNAQPSKPLTDDEIIEIAEGYGDIVWQASSAIDFARAIEAALGITKGTK